MDRKRLSLELIDQVQVTRSFSKKVQIAQYEPVDVFASFTATIKGGVSELDVLKVSSELNKLAVTTVESDMNSYYTAHVKPF